MDTVDLTLGIVFVCAITFLVCGCFVTAHEHRRRT
jgi:hypothetical protein